MAINILQINRLYGGIADTETFGTPGSYADGYNLDIHDKADVLIPSKRTVKETASVITDQIKWMTTMDDGTIYALADNGKIYKRTTGAVWTLDHTDTNGGNGQGLQAFNGDFYYASENNLGRYDSTGMSYNDNQETFDNGDDAWHPMTVWGVGRLYIGDGNKVATVETSGLFVPDALTLPEGYRIRSIVPISDQLLAIGTWRGTDITKNEDGRIFMWDGVSDSFNTDVIVRDGGVLSMGFSHPFLYFVSGTAGVLRVYNMAEVIKYGLIREPDFFEWLEENVGVLRTLDSSALRHAILESCACKARVVEEDETEGGVRAILNLGHTFGHAIETHCGYGEWLHGEAVGAGIAMAAEMSCDLGALSEHDLARVIALLQQAGLPIEGPDNMSVENYLDHMAVDKKVIDGALRLVLMKRLGFAYVTEDFPLSALKKVLAG